MDDDMLSYEADDDDETKWLPSNDVINTTNESELSSASYMPNSTNSWPSPSSAGVSGLTVALVLVYGVICVAGLIGNLLVVYVVARHTRMKTATNVYIMNLSVADALFLIGLPMIMTTSILRYWVFGQILCKVYYVLTCVNTFTGTFTLTLMSADRFVAVWYPIKSLKYRTPKYAAAEAVATWFLSAIVMSPIVLYAEAVPNYFNSMSCQVRFPVAHAITTARIYVVYTLIVGFLLPVTCITIFYALLVFRLRTNRDQIRAAGKRRRQLRHRNVTALVTLVIAVYVICWLPYWGFQVNNGLSGKYNCSTFNCYANACNYLYLWMVFTCFNEFAQFSRYIAETLPVGLSAGTGQ